MQQVAIKAQSQNQELFKTFVTKLAKVEKCEFVQTKPENSIGDVGESCECFLLLENIDLSGIKHRLENQKSKLEAEVCKLTAMLSNENFVKNAPKNVIQTNQEGLDNAKEKLQKVLCELEALKG